jgi:hypothetical protein
LLRATFRSGIEEENMVQVSEKAGEMIRQFLEGREGPRSIRVLMAGGG